MRSGGRGAQIIKHPNAPILLIYPFKTLIDIPFMIRGDTYENIVESEILVFCCGIPAALLDSGSSTGVSSPLSGNAVKLSEICDDFC